MKKTLGRCCVAAVPHNKGAFEDIGTVNNIEVTLRQHQQLGDVNSAQIRLYIAGDSAHRMADLLQRCYGKLGFSVNLRSRDPILLYIRQQDVSDRSGDKGVFWVPACFPRDERAFISKVTASRNGRSEFRLEFRAAIVGKDYRNPPQKIDGKRNFFFCGSSGNLDWESDLPAAYRQPSSPNPAGT